MAILVPPCLGRESCGRLVAQARLHHERDTGKFRCRVPQVSVLDSTSGRAGLGGASCGRLVAQAARFHRYTARSTRRPPKSACRVRFCCSSGLGNARFLCLLQSSVVFTTGGFQISKHFLIWNPLLNLVYMDRYMIYMDRYMIYIIHHIYG